LITKYATKIPAKVVMIANRKMVDRNLPIPPHFAKRKVETESAYFFKMYYLSLYAFKPVKGIEREWLDKGKLLDKTFKL